MRSNIVKENNRIITSSSSTTRNIEPVTPLDLEEREIFNRPEFIITENSTVSVSNRARDIVEETIAAEANIKSLFDKYMADAKNNHEKEIELDKNKNEALFKLHQEQYEKFSKELGEEAMVKEFTEIEKALNDIRKIHETKYLFSSAQTNSAESALRYNSMEVNAEVHTNDTTNLDALKESVIQSEERINETRAYLDEEQKKLENLSERLEDDLIESAHLNRRTTALTNAWADLADESTAALERVQAHNNGANYSTWSDRIYPLWRNIKNTIIQEANVLEASEVGILGVGGLIGGVSAVVTGGFSIPVSIGWACVQPTLIAGYRIYINNQKKKENNEDKDKKKDKE